MNAPLPATSRAHSLIQAARGHSADAAQLRLADAATPLEARALRAHAARVGVVVDADGAVDLARSEGLVRGVRGGAAAIRRAASQDDTAEQLSLAELRTLQRGRLAELFAPAGGEVVAHAQLRGATGALEATADQLLALGDRVARADFADDDAPITALRRMAARATKTADDLDRALSDAALAFASPEQLERLSAAHARVTAALGHLDATFGAPGLDRLLFQVKESYGSGYGAITPQLAVLEAGDAVRAALARVAAHAPTFAPTSADAAR